MVRPHPMGSVRMDNVAIDSLELFTSICASNLVIGKQSTVSIETVALGTMFAESGSVLESTGVFPIVKEPKDILEILVGKGIDADAINDYVKSSFYQVDGMSSQRVYNHIRGDN
jgi:hypothetical protein